MGNTDQSQRDQAEGVAVNRGPAGLRGGKAVMGR
jgi:hypothetical protein